MANFAPVCPINMLEKLHEVDELGRYHLLLVPDVLQEKKRYHKLFNCYPYCTIILDNAVIEMSDPVSTEQTIEAIHVFDSMGCRLIVELPDMLLDKDQTIVASQKALAQYKIEKLRSIEFMLIPQGKTPKEFLQCAEAFENDTRVQWIGVARNYIDKLQRDTRENIILALHALFPSAKIHMLGFSNILHDDIKCAKLPYVYGIDSAAPMRLGQMGYRLKLSEPAYPPRAPNDWATMGNDILLNDVALENLRNVRKWVQQSTR